MTRRQALKALSGDHSDDFQRFVEAVSQRLETGREAYGNASFDRPVDELLEEIGEELLDVCGWSFILWSRLQRIKNTVGKEGI